MFVFLVQRSMKELEDQSFSGSVEDSFTSSQQSSSSSSSYNGMCMLHLKDCCCLLNLMIQKLLVKESVRGQNNVSLPLLHHKEKTVQQTF